MEFKGDTKKKKADFSGFESRKKFYDYSFNDFGPENKDTIEQRFAETVSLRFEKGFIRRQVKNLLLLPLRIIRYTVNFVVDLFIFFLNSLNPVQTLNKEVLFLLARIRNELLFGLEVFRRFKNRELRLPPSRQFVLESFLKTKGVFLIVCVFLNKLFILWITFNVILRKIIFNFFFFFHTVHLDYAEHFNFIIKPAINFYKNNLLFVVFGNF